jgi:hypothetical protein
MPKEVPQPFVLEALLKQAVFSATPKRNKVALFGLFFHLLYPLVMTRASAKPKKFNALAIQPESGTALAIRS